MLDALEIEDDDETQPASLSRQAYEALRERIITLQLRPGSPLNEPALMEELGLGRTPIREAVQRLACEGLVVLRPRRGAFVASLSLLDLQQLFELRQELEGYAAALAAERATPADRAALQATLTALEDPALPAGDAQAHIEIDRAFHRALARAAHNRFLEYTLLRLYHLNLRLWYLALAQVGPMRSALEQHTAVLTAITARDSQGAAAAMRRHIQDFQDRIKALL